MAAFSSASWGQRGVAVYDPTSAQEVWSHRFDAHGAEEEPEDDEEETHWVALRLAFAAGGARRCIWFFDASGQPTNTPYPTGW